MFQQWVTIIFIFSYLLFCLSSPVGRCVVKGRSAARCTGWRTATCGAPPAAGKRPARDSLTECFPSARQPASPCITMEQEERPVILHAFGFLQLKVATVRQAPAPLVVTLPTPSPLPHLHWTKGQRSHLLHCRPGLPVLPRHSHLSQFLGNPSAAKQCKENRSNEFSCFFMLGSVLHLSMFCKALVFKWKVSWKKEGVQNKGQKIFLCVFC